MFVYIRDHVDTGDRLMERRLSSLVVERRSVPCVAEIGLYRSGDRTIHVFPIYVSDSGPLKLLMMHKSFVMAKLDSLRGRADLNTVLQLTGEKPKEPKAGEPEDPEPGTSKRKAGADPGKSKKGQLDAESFRSLEVKGTMPKKKKGTFSGGQQAASVYGLRNWSEFTLLQEYLHLNGRYQLRFVPKDGTCMWRSMLESTNYPAEYQPELLQRQIVLFMAENADFLFPILRSHIQGTYGCIRLSPEEYLQKQKDGTLTTIQEEDQNTPGPYSYISYLEALLQAGTWGDYGVVLAASFMWQIKITIIVVDTTHEREDQWIRQEVIRHDSALKNADMVMVFCGGNHYVPTGKS